MKLLAATMAVTGAVAQRRGNRRQQNSLVNSLARFRGDFNALRQMPNDMVSQAFCLLNKAQAESQLDKLYFDMFCDKAEREGMPPHVYDSMIHGLVSGDPLAPPDPGMMRGVLCPNEESCIVPLTLRGIWGYGCWCNFEVDLMDGSSQPVNKFDAVCKDMQQCLRCAALDARLDTPERECNPKDPEFQYNATYSFFTASQSIVADCSSQNKDLCSTQVCTCEIGLISGVLRELWDGAAYELDYLHERGFEQDKECVGTPGDNEPGQASLPNPQCCGYYPSREVYNGNRHGCCVQSDRPDADRDTETVYSLTADTCCTDGTVVGPGELCSA